ncbi:MAG TPA: Rossmann-like and DUF2520 domain-containing protein [Puia sp.]|nr:Rossmann-like and DUF2520 domain-containing protein [Puia sp.]
MKIVIIGSGNVATVLGRRIFKAGHEIVQVISKHQAHAAVLAKELGCNYASGFNCTIKEADLYIIAISDNALIEIGRHLLLDDRLVVHTAGSVSKTILKKVSKNYGVLYPLQSLRKETGNNVEIPLLLDANTSENLARVNDFAKTISGFVKHCDDHERLKLHAGAVIVNNFSNYLYALTEDFCKEEQVDFKLLLPLIKETASRLNFFSAHDMQTGPAVRNDFETVKKHLAILQQYPALKEIYEWFTNKISVQ